MGQPLLGNKQVATGRLKHAVASVEITPPQAASVVLCRPTAALLIWRTLVLQTTKEGTTAKPAKVLENATILLSQNSPES